MKPNELQQLAQAYAFLGNSLLGTMNATSTAGLEPGFWERFPSFQNDRVAQAVACCADFAVEAQGRIAQGQDVATDVSVEFTYLFVGPKGPAAAPWETAYTSASPTVGFGEPTFRMQRALAEAGLQVSHENNQYADHMGIELLLLSELCRRESLGQDCSLADAATAAEFAAAYPQPWLGAFSQAVAQAAPGGYYERLLNLAGALLELQAS
ncbi:MAG: molecular chaperone TorD family protein [Coriobacteriia bacterium]|nr:molecular chaperone TorD family protein [Coriobacteriia bacterium]